MPIDIMTSIVRMRPISGGAGAETPHCYLLEVDEFTFLLDCGWDPLFSEDLTRELKKHIHRIDAVLLSYPDNLHLGALPHAVGKLGLSCPIYATVPVHKMGQMFLYDLYQARRNMEDFELFTLDEVDKTFDMITQLKYNQSVQLTGKGAGLTITPISAGHMIGGAMWRIVKEGEEDIVYAVDYNHKRERHLNGADVEKISRPSLLITDALNATYTQVRRRGRDEQLMTTILQTLRGGGNVLVCVDTAGRVLELAHMVDQLWQNKDSGLLAYSLALLNNVSYNVVEFAKSQIEWMSEKLMRTFEGRRNNPFAFRHMKHCHSIAEVNKVPSPKVVLASMPDMECGFSRELFAQWAGNKKNSIILTSRSSDGTLTADLIKNGGDRVIDIWTGKRVKLQGFELEEYKRREKERKNREDGLMDDDEASSSSDEEMEASGGGTAAKPKSVKHDIIMKPSASSHPGAEPGGGRSQKRGFFKSTKSKFPMYPHHEEKIRWDDYGEIVKIEEWIDHTATIANDNNESGGADGGAAPSGANGTSNSLLEDSNNVESSEVPTKCVRQNASVHVKAQIQYIDFEGRSDGESVDKLIRQVKPRRVIIVRGSDEACEVMAKLAETVTADTGVGSNARVFLARTGEMVDATTESYIYQMRLPESLMAKISFQHAKDNAYLGWVDGRVTYPEELKDINATEDEDKENVEDMETGESQPKKSKIPTLEPLPEDEVVSHPPNFVNELKLSDFKMVLSKHNIASEFQGGVLFCGSGTVALRRHDSGRVTIEGCVSNEYYQVRDLLYQQYAIV